MDCSIPGSSPPLSPRVCSDSCPLSWWCYLTISSSVVPFSFCLQSFPVSRSFPVSQFFISGSQSIRASASASVLLMFRVDFLQDWLVWSLCSPRGSQESSQAPQFESIDSSALSLLYGPTITSIHNYWKNHVSVSCSVMSNSLGPYGL